MQYRLIAEQSELHDTLHHLSTAERLWVDTEIADWQTGQGHLSLIQVLADEPSSEVLFVDALAMSASESLFVDAVMANPAIEKVFHNSSFDTRYLGGNAAANVTCTLRLARSIPSFQLPVESYSLKSLTEYFGIADSVDKSEQTSDWGLRPLSDEQLLYAARDVLFLRDVHFQLMDLVDQQDTPDAVSIPEIDRRLASLEASYESLKSERDYLRGLLKEAMLEQGCEQSESYRLSRSRLAPLDVPLTELATRIVESGLQGENTGRLNRAIQNQLGPLAASLESATEPTEQVRLLRC